MVSRWQHAGAMRPARILTIHAILFGILIAAPNLFAQTNGAGKCPGGRISSIEIRRHPVFDDSAGAMLSKFYDAANWLHVETRERVIRRELLFREGDCYEPLKLSESARLLREFSFLKRVDVETSPRANSTVDVTVDTHDDWSLQLEPRIEMGSGLGFGGFSLAERNVGGTGRSVELFFIDRTGRNEMGARYYDPQFLATRWNLDLAAARTEPGLTVRQVVGYPFVGLVGRWAAFQYGLFGERWFRYIPGDLAERRELILPLRQNSLQAGGAIRLAGEPRGKATKLGTYGLTLSYEKLEYDSPFYQDSLVENEVGISEEEADSRLSSLLLQRETLRWNFVAGVRGLEFVKRRGLSTLRAEEDIPIGASGDLVLGFAPGLFGTSDKHFLVGLAAYGGAKVTGGWLSLVRASFEGRRDYEARDWRDMFGALQWSNFWLLGPRHTVELTGRWSAGWDVTVPFQLTLGGPTGVRGYDSHRFPGGARAVVSLEDRTHLWSAGRLFDMGTTVFLDVGQMWSNEAIFATDSDLRASLGVGLRVATPTGTRLTYQLDIAMPIDGGARLSDLTITFRTLHGLRLFDRAVDRELARSRDIALRSAAEHFK